MTTVSFVLRVALLSSIILSAEARTIAENISRIGRSRRDASPYLASRLMGFGQNRPDSNLFAQNSGQFGFRSGSSQLNSNGAVSPSFPTASHEGVDLVNNGTGLNIAYQGIPSSRSTSTAVHFLTFLPPVGVQLIPSCPFVHSGFPGTCQGCSGLGRGSGSHG